MNEIDYWVSKVKWDANGTRIISMYVHLNEDNSVGVYEEMSRYDIIKYINDGYIFCSIIKQENGKWQKGNYVITDGSLLKNIDSKLPFIQTKRKTFVSYYHKDDSDYKKKFLNLMDDLIVNKSVEDGDINSDVSDEYAKQMIQKGFLHDTTVLIVLLSNKTKCRKHVDWEISGALNYKVGDSYAGLLGLKLPTHDDYVSGKCTYSKIPDRLADNFKSGYAIVRDYTTDRKILQGYIEEAYSLRKKNADKRVNSRVQMKNDTCE
ncbi:MAG: TIR domain-containing protein [Sulfurimonas sp.]|nr:TIR domain-containing protein [Sulfurimonas sp.]